MADTNGFAPSKDSTTKFSVVSIRTPGDVV